jgi:hypothetical protein
VPTDTGQTDMTKLIVAFRSFSNAPKTEAKENEKEKVRTVKFYPNYLI